MNHSVSHGSPPGIEKSAKRFGPIVDDWISLKHSRSDMEKKTKSELIKEIRELRNRLHEAEDILHAIRNGEADAILVNSPKGEQVYSLKGAEHPYRVIVESINEGAVTLTLDGTILYSNMRFAEMVKQPLEKIISASFYDFIPKRQRNLFSELLKPGVKEGAKGRFTLVTGVEGVFLPVYLSLNSLLVDNKPSLSMIITNLTEILEKETFANTILDQVAEAVVVCNEDGLIIRLNQAAQTLCQQNSYLQPFDKIVPLRYSEKKRNSQKLPFSISTILKKKTIKNLEVDMDSENGQTLHFILNTGALPGVQNKDLGYVITLTDITALKKTEKALEIDQLRFFSLLNELPGYVALQAPDYSIRYANRYFRKIFGDPDGRLCYEMMHGYSSPCKYCPTLRVFETKNTETWEWTSADGKVYQVYDYPFIDIDGSPLVLELGIDISDRKRAEEALRTSENNYRLLLENLPQKIYYKDKDSVYVSCNENFARDLHISSNKIKGKTDYNFFPEELAEKYRADDKRITESGKAEEIEERYVKDGKELIVHTIKAPIRDQKGDIIGILGVFWDVTRKILLEREAERSRHLAAIGELAAGIGHEINNPMTGIINCAQILFNKSQEGSKEKDISSRIIKEGDRIANIVHRLLTFARPIDQNEKRSIVHVRDILSDTLILTESQLRKEGIRLQLNIPPDLPEIFVHSQQLQQVFLNIISNARYALNKKYPKTHDDKVLEILAKEVVIDKHSQVKLTFYDHGIGMPPDIKDKILDPFFTTKPRGEGTGLGLSISCNIIKDHGGKLLIDSAEGKFTKVTVILPVKGNTIENNL